jgi:hypothetical protein
VGWGQATVSTCWWRGDLRSARERFEQSLEIRQGLAKANLSSAAAQRDLVVSYAKLGQLTGEKDWWSKTLEIAERLNRDGHHSAGIAKRSQSWRRGGPAAGSAQAWLRNGAVLVLGRNCKTKPICERWCKHEPELSRPRRMRRRTWRLFDFTLAGELGGF